jgi:hypothetical protein
LKKRIILAVAMALLFSACATAADEVSSGASEAAENQTLESEAGDINKYECINLGDINVIIEKDAHYILYTNAEKTAFRYEVFDAGGNYMDGGVNDYHGFRFSYQDGLLEMRKGTTGTWMARYYDTEKSYVSRFFFMPKQTCGNLIAYYDRDNEGNRAVFVENIFDKEKYSMKLKREFCSAMGPIETEFLNDGTQLRITYEIQMNDKYETELVTETIDLY